MPVQRCLSENTSPMELNLRNALETGEGGSNPAGMDGGRVSPSGEQWSSLWSRE